MGNPTDETAPAVGEDAGYLAAATVLDCDWADLAEWIGKLCTVNSPCLPSALWLLSTCTTPLKLFRPTAAERQVMEEMAEGAEKRFLNASAPKATKSSGGAPLTLIGLAKTVKGMFQVAPQQFPASLCFLCDFWKAFPKITQTCEPTASELEALLDELECRRPHLVPGVLQIMTAHPVAGAVAKDWRPPKRSREQVIVRMYASLNIRLLQRYTRFEARCDPLTAELTERLRELPARVVTISPDTKLVELPVPILEKMVAIFEDEHLPMERKLVAVIEVLAEADHPTPTETNDPTTCSGYEES